MKIFLAFLALSLSPALLRAQTATLTWNPPTTNTDGSPLTDLAGYNVHYGTSSAVYTQTVNVGLTVSPSTPSYVVTGLAPGNTYYFVVTAYDTSGNRSAYSNQGFKPIAFYNPPAKPKGLRLAP